MDPEEFPPFCLQQLDRVVQVFHLINEHHIILVNVVGKQDVWLFSL